MRYRPETSWPRRLAPSACVALSVMPRPTRLRGPRASGNAPWCRADAAASPLHVIDVMTRWEYRRLDLDIADVPKPAFEEALNALGREGWELVASLQHERHGYSHEVHLVFKRAASAPLAQ